MIPIALRILSRFWLEEIREDDQPLLTSLPELAETLPHAIDTNTLTELAAEYQRLFGFNLPPYESLFLDPSVMLMAPATERVLALYRQVGWTPPTTRVGAVDHLGLELLALADFEEQGRMNASRQLHQMHLALWLPVFAQSLQRLKPHPFYATLLDLTLDLVLDTLPPAGDDAAPVPLPDLPPPPVYRDSGELPPDMTDNTDRPAWTLRRVLKPFLPPRFLGTFITREDIARLAQSLSLPLSMGDRYRMLEALFRAAGQSEQLPALQAALIAFLEQSRADYLALVETYPAWRPYAQTWLNILTESQQQLQHLPLDEVSFS